jgi:predicted acetyltransferase
VTDVAVRRVSGPDRLVVDRLFQLFQHDLSEFRGTLPDGGGRFRDGWVDSAFGDPAWAGYLLTAGENPVGFSFVRALDEERRVLNSFFVVRAMRRRGIGLASVLEVLAQHPGPWQVAFQDANAGAADFWRRVATEAAGQAWSEERRGVPKRADLPPDVWISFEVGAGH